MIYASTPNTRIDEFEALLEKTKALLIQANITQDQSPTDFEDTLEVCMNQAARGTTFENKIQRTGKHGFPDILAEIVANNYFGVEAKVTQKDHWKTTGNSIFESTRMTGVNRIYLYFAKLAPQPEFKYRLYQECLEGISVTHSPRYKINMELDDGQSIFDKINEPYDSFRKSSSKASTLRNFYRQLHNNKNIDVWWLEKDEEIINENPVIRPYQTLSTQEKDNFRAKAYLFFPEIFSNDNLYKYSKAAAYLLKQHNAINPSFRDIFSAGGKKNISIENQIYHVSATVARFYDSIDQIKGILTETPQETLESIWEIPIAQSIEETWISLLDSTTGDSEAIKAIIRTICN